MQETWVWSVGWEDVLKKGMATHSSILAWRIPWTEEPGGLQSMGSQRAGHDWVSSKHTHTHTHTHTRILSLLSPSHWSRLSPSIGLGSLCYAVPSHPLCILHVVLYISQRYSLSSSCPFLSPMDCVHESILSSLALQIGSSVPFF